MDSNKNIQGCVIALKMLRNPLGDLYINYLVWTSNQKSYCLLSQNYWRDKHLWGTAAGYFLSANTSKDNVIFVFEKLPSFSSFFGVSPIF